MQEGKEQNEKVKGAKDARIPETARGMGGEKNKTKIRIKKKQKSKLGIAPASWRSEEVEGAG